MVYGLTIMGISAGVLLVLTALFRTENKRGGRVLLSAARNFLDSLVLKIVGKCESALGSLHAGVFRTTIHYVIHHILGGVIATLTRLQKKLFRVYEKNKWQHVVSDHEGQGDAHLNEIAKHKKETALTPAQRKKLSSH